MGKRGRIWMGVAGVVAALLVGLLVLPHLMNTDRYRIRIETALSSALGRPVHLGHVELSILSGSLVADGASIGDDAAFSSQPFLAAKSIRVGVGVAALVFRRELHITGLTIEQPQITLLRRDDGTWNYSSLGGEGKSQARGAANPLPNLTVKQLDIKDGVVTVGTLPAQGQPRVYSKLNVSAQNFSLTSAFAYEIRGTLPAGGELEISGNAGPINAQDVSLTPLTAQVVLKHGDLVGAGMVQPQLGISGIADLDAKIVSNGQLAQLEGKLHLERLKLVANGTASSQPVDVDFSVSQNLKALAGNIEHANLKIGDADMMLAGSYQTQGNVTTVQASAKGEAMAINDLEAFFPSLGMGVPADSRLQGGTLTLKLDASDRDDRIVLSGPVRVANTQLIGFDLGQKLAGIQALTGARTGANTTVELLSADLQDSPDGIRMDNLEAVVAGLGSATGSGSISPSGVLDYHLLVKLAAGNAGSPEKGVNAISAARGSVASVMTKGGVPVTVGGTMSNPTFAPDMGKMVSGIGKSASQAPSSVGKALGGLLKHK